MLRVTAKELDYPGDGVYYYRGERFTGIMVFPESSGWVSAEHEYRDGLLSGVKREWYRPGQLSLLADCALGVYHGRVRQWHESGARESDAYYEYGIRLRGRTWDEAGVLVEDFALPESDPSFELLQAYRRAEAEWRASQKGQDEGNR